VSLWRAAFAALALSASVCVAHEPVALPARSAAAVTDPRVADESSRAGRAALLRSAEVALVQGQTAQAVQDFDRAAMLLHAADTEMGLVRAYVQAGEYRRALAFCAHTAGAHLDSAPASALYAWLLRAGGQGDFGQRVLDEALLRAPADGVVKEVVREFLEPLPIARGVLLESPHRLAPHSVVMSAQPMPTDTSRLVSGAVLLDQGRRALVPRASLPVDGSELLWVRNGLGRLTLARLDPEGQPPAALGVAVLLLAVPLEPPEGQMLAPRDPFAGSPGFVVTYAASGRSDAAWPWLHQGFFGGYEGQSGLRRLGIEAPAGLPGAAVFDAAGRLAGITLPNAQRQMLPVSLWKEWAGASDAAASSPASRMPADEAYERGLRVGLQLIVGR
jgi:hypothetical protein